jgi:hypothetical protein
LRLDLLSDPELRGQSHYFGSVDVRGALTAILMANRVVAHAWILTFLLFFNEVHDFAISDCFEHASEVFVFSRQKQLNQWLHELIFGWLKLRMVDDG